MICNCGIEGILNQANGNEFWYCKQCKDEIRLQEVKRPTITKEFLLSCYEPVDLLPKISREFSGYTDESHEKKPTHSLFSFLIGRNIKYYINDSYLNCYYLLNKSKEPI